MSEDFVTQLRLQLREAAEREARRRPAARLGREAAALRLWRPALALAAIAVLVVVLIGFARDVAPRHTTPAHPGLRLLLHAPIVGQGGPVYAGFGSVWADDAATGDILRLDPRTGGVRARIHVPGETGFGVGAGAVWALDGGGRRLLRIDPATNRVIARVALRERAGGVLVAGDGVWVGSKVELQLVDPRRNAVIATVHPGRAGYQIDGVATDGHDLYVSRADGTLLVYDAVTGAQRPSPGVAIQGAAVAAAPGVVFSATDKGVSALDVRTGRTRWTAALPAKGLNYTIAGAGAVWTEGIDRDSGRDRLWRLDAASGRVTGSLALPEFGASGMTIAAGRLWLVSAKGVLQIID